jgi:hypothetical protein
MILLIGCSGMVQSVRASEFRDTLVVGKDTVTVSIGSVPFQASAHRIKSSTSISAHGRDTLYVVEQIDGRKPHGTDGEIPRNEIGKFNVTWGGRPLRIPKSLYSDCFEPILTDALGDVKSGHEPFVIQAVASEDGSSVLINMYGSDAAGSYEVWWIISKNGKHRRFITLSPWA